jgi:NAD(P)H-quinone oxidoreductase subunit 5
LPFFSPTYNVTPLSYWVVLLPFLAGSLIILLPFLFNQRRDTAGFKKFSMYLSVGSVFICFWLSVLIFGQLAYTQVPYQVDWTWFQSGSFKLTIGVLIDNLTAVMLIVVTLVSLLVQIYTHGYMREDPGYSRFYSYLSLFTGSMLGLVVATNMFQMYFFWELVGVCSYFLIGFWWYKPSAAYACMKAFVVNRIGDFGFLLAILMFLGCTWGFWQANPQHGLLAFSDPSHIDLAGAIRWALANHSLTAAGWTSAISLTVIATIMFMGPMAKSAQFPLHVWLPDAMEGPTPISALIHAATMVAAGIYMVARAYPIWLNWANPASPTPFGSEALGFVTFIGTFTAFMAATVALTQVDIKRALAWSTCSQLGYMFAGLGVGAFTGGMFHLFTHAFFKAMLFLCSGSVIHALHGEQDMRKMGGLKEPLTYTHAAFLIGCLAISGFPLFSGFFSKDEIIGAAMGQNPFAGIMLIITAFLTAFYMFRMYFMTFWGSYRGTVTPHAEHKLSPITAPLIVLCVPSVAAGFLGLTNAYIQPFAHVIAESPFGFFVHWASMEPEAINWPVMLTSSACGLVGIWLAWMVYAQKSININSTIANASPGLYNFSFNRWYGDDVYHGAAAILMTVFNSAWMLIDKFIVDNIVNATSVVVRSLGTLLRYIETGQGQSYALVIFGCVAVITILTYFFYLP